MERTQISWKIIYKYRLMFQTKWKKHKIWNIKIKVFFTPIIIYVPFNYVTCYGLNYVFPKFIYIEVLTSNTSKCTSFVNKGISDVTG
jgi:hypothetical protein